MKKFFYALAVLCGTIIGVGLFGLPYVASKTGFWILILYFLVLGAIVYFLHLLFSEVCLRTRGKQRLPGYAEKYLGKWGKRISFFSVVSSLYGALLAYIIVGGKFLHSLFSSWLGGQALWYAIVFFVFGALFIFFGIRSIAPFELWMLGLFFVILIIFFVFGSPQIEIQNLTISGKLSNLFLPYGVVLFSLWGIPLIPELEDILGKKKKLMKKVCLSGVWLAVLTYLLFIVLILGVCGSSTTEEALIGLESFLGRRVVAFGLTFGVLTCFTSFLTLGLTLKKVFWYDFKIPKNTSFVLACFIPLLAYILGLSSFIKVVSVTGGVMLAINGILVILMHRKAKKLGDDVPAYSISYPKAISYFLILLFVLGIIYEIFYFIRG